MVDSSFIGIIIVSIAAGMAVNYAVLFFVIRAAVRSSRKGE